MKQVTTKQHQVNCLCLSKLQDLLKRNEGIVLADFILLPNSLQACAVL